MMAGAEGDDPESRGSSEGVPSPTGMSPSTNLLNPKPAAPPSSGPSLPTGPINHRDSTMTDDASFVGGVSLSTALDRCGLGTFHYFLLAICSLANASDAVEILAISFVQPVVFEQFHASDVLKGWLSAISFVGLFFGGVLWGRFADSLGRRTCLMSALFVNAFFGLLSTFSKGIGILMVFRFFTGLGIGGSIPVVFTYFSEFFTDRLKARWVVFLSLSWMLGSIFTAGAAWAILSHDEIHFSSTRSVSSWRVFLVICCLPALFAAVGVYLYPESPQYLLGKERHDEALVVLRKIHRINRSRTFSVDFTLHDLDPESDIVMVDSGFSCNSVIRFFVSIFRVYMAPLTTKAVLNTTIWFALSFGFYGFTIWQPQYLKDKGLESDDSKSFLYFSTFLIAIVQFPGTFISSWTVDALGRRWTLVLSLALSGLSTFFLLLVSNKTEVVVLTCVFSGVSVAAWNMLNVLSTEMFPWEVRGTAYGVFAAVGRIGSIVGNLVFGLFESSNSAIPLSCASIALIIAAVSAFFLPEKVPGNATGRNPSTIIVH